MRMIFEEGDDQDYLEIILSDDDIEDIKDHLGISVEAEDESEDGRKLNIFIRRDSYAA